MLDLRERIAAGIKKLDLAALEKEVAALEEKTAAPAFWQENEGDAGQRLFAELKRKKELAETWRALEGEVAALKELSQDAAPEELAELEGSLEEKLERAELSLFLGGKHDAAGAIFSLFAGTGGTDAQDWTEMLLRAYLRFFEKMGWKAELLDSRGGEEAGLKSAVVEVRGENSYGFLRRERGTHRLIRLSPFNAKSLRQTSFAGVEVAPLLEKADAAEINPADLRVDTFRASGAGGQHINKTESAVRLTHIPTGLVASCQAGRSQMANRDKAMAMLASLLAAKKEEEEAKELAKARGEKFSADFGSQIRTTTLHPYQQVKDHRSGWETSQTEKYLDGEILPAIEAAMRGGF